MIQLYHLKTILRDPLDSEIKLQLSEQTNKRFLSSKPILQGNERRKLPTIVHEPVNHQRAIDRFSRLSEHSVYSRTGKFNPNRVMFEENQSVDPEYDTVKNYEVYFPHNNISKIIEEIERKEKKKNQRINIENIKVTPAINEDLKDNLFSSVSRFINKQARRSSMSSYQLDSTLKQLRKDHSPMSKFAQPNKVVAGENDDNSPASASASPAQINKLFDKPYMPSEQKDSFDINQKELAEMNQ